MKKWEVKALQFEPQINIDNNAYESSVHHVQYVIMSRCRGGTALVAHCENRGEQTHSTTTTFFKQRTSSQTPSFFYSYSDLLSLFFLRFTQNTLSRKLHQVESFNFATDKNCSIIDTCAPIGWTKKFHPRTAHKLLYWNMTLHYRMFLIRQEFFELSTGWWWRCLHFH